MHPHNRKKLDDRVIRAAEAALAARKYVSPVDVLVGIGWLDPHAVKRWQQGQIDYLEGVVQTNLPRISEAMKLFRSWATAKGLTQSETQYVARTPSRQPLRFSKSGNPAIERLYRTHWISGELSERKRERLVVKASRVPELVVIQPLKDTWRCHQCGGAGDLLIMESPGPTCLRCTGLDDLFACRRCTPHPPGEGEKLEACRGSTLQQDPAPLRTTRSTSQAARFSGSATRARSAGSRVRAAGLEYPILYWVENGAPRPMKIGTIVSLWIPSNRPKTNNGDLFF